MNGSAQVGRSSGLLILDKVQLVLYLLIRILKFGIRCEVLLDIKFRKMCYQLDGVRISFFYSEQKQGDDDD